MHQTFRLTLVLYVCLAGFSAFQATAVADDDAATIQAVLDQVAAQRDEIVSAEIHYRWCIGSYRRGENTPERVHALLDEYDLVGEPDSLRELVNTLAPQFEPNDPPWEIRDFVKLGDKRRADTSRGTIQLVDGDHEMTYHQYNAQLTVENRGGSSVHRTKMEDFRSFPPIHLGVDDFRVVEQRAGQITLAMVVPDATADFIPSRYTIDEATGVMTHGVQYSRGELYTEVWQKGLTEYAGGITMPALRITTLYKQGRLNTLTVWIVEDARFNEPVDEERFVMPIPEQTVLVDYRMKETSVRKIKSQVDDVRSILAPVASTGPGVVGRGEIDWRLVLILNGIGLIAIAAVLWRRGAHTTQPVDRPPAGTPKNS